MKYLVLGLESALTVGFMAVCFFIMPSGLLLNSGFSYYGVHASTFIPYTATFTGLAVLLLQFTRRLRAVLSTYARNALYLLPLALIGVWLTPYDTFVYLHTFFAVSLFAIEGLIILYMLWKSKDRMNELFAVTEALLGVITILFFTTAQGFMLESQVLYQVVFVLLLFRMSRLCERRSDYTVQRYTKRPHRYT